MSFNFFCLILGQLYGLEKFWAFLKYYKHGKQLQVRDNLKEWLKKYKKLEDFRVVSVSIPTITIT